MFTVVASVSLADWALTQLFDVSPSDVNVRRWHGGFSAIAVAVWAYSTVAAGLWLTLELLVDHAWPATMVAFGPRWLLLLPALPLLVLSLFKAADGTSPRLIAAITGAVVITLIGVMDFRLGLGRTSGISNVRVMTHNLGGSFVTAEALDGLTRAEGIDVASLQECPFYDLKPERLGWHFYYAGDLCLVSRFPYSVLSGADPTKPWRGIGRSPMLFEIQRPTGAFHLLIVHLQTIRGGIESLGAWDGVRNLQANRNDSERESHAARAMITSGRPVVVAGDFNLPVESGIYRADWQDFQNAFSRCGRGFGYTKFTSMHGIRIDHVIDVGAVDVHGCTCPSQSI